MSILAILLTAPVTGVASCSQVTSHHVWRLRISVSRKQNGFTLIESLIVVALISTIAAIAVPALFRSQLSANEALAMESLRAIHRAEMAYSNNHPVMGYASGLLALGPNRVAIPCVPDPAGVTGACLIDSELASGRKHGYTISITSTENLPITSYEVSASPVSINKTGSRYFCESEEGVMRSSTSAITVGSCKGVSSRVQ